MTHRIGVIGGDGIGPEVVAEAMKVVEACGVAHERVDYDLGAHRYLEDGTVLPDEVLEEWRGLDAILLGAVGDPAPGVAAPAGLVERGILLRMRFELDQYINLRPFRLPPRIDCEVIRENTEGSYAGEGGFLRKGTPHEIATQGSVNTRMGVERCIRFAFDRAAVTERKHLTLVHKKNVLTFAGDLWQRVFDEVAEEYPQVATGYDHVDAACIHFVERPERYDVVVTDNLFGDILTDLGGAVAGGVGFAASANLNPARTGPSMFEPVHGTAPDIAGTGTANPIAAIISVGLMLDFLGESDAAARVAAACGSPERYSGSTADIGDAVVEAVRG
jgi:3-isopropylmalate dehydrogenase